MDELEPESHLHAEFASMRRRGEWLEPAPALSQRIAELTVDT
jgi:1,2-phenylacetyl-CoA epoxidase catalytic subunit